jgi:elongation factor Ts
MGAGQIAATPSTAGSINSKHDEEARKLQRNLRGTTMANITASMVKELRERTGLGMMDCKKALAEADGDMEKAIEDLRKASGLKAAKKASRVASEGVVLIKIAEEGNYGVIIEVNSETDFVARDDNFLQFSEQALDAAFANQEADVAAILDGGLETDRQALVQKIGENINLRRVGRVALDGETNGVIESYVHNNKIGVLIALKGGDEAVARDVAMHIAAANPMVVRSDDISKDVLDKEEEIYKAQAADSGKPEEIVAKMVEGRMRKFKEEVSLMDQGFVKDPDKKVGALLKESDADVISFLRFEVGEGIEKEDDDFAAEVAAQLAG